jgi:hypothetical protein
MATIKVSGALLAASLALVSGNNKVTELVSAFHFQDIVRDTPFEHRPPSLIAFWSEGDGTCNRAYREWQFHEGLTQLPERQNLFVATYDVDRQYEFAWFKFTEGMDLPARLGITACPAMAVIPRDWTGRENTSDADVRVWDNQGDWRAWANAQLADIDPPEIDAEKFTDKNMMQRDDGESRCHHRNSITPPRIPHYTERGWDVFEMPDELYNRLVAYHKKFEHKRTTEPWSGDQIETNYHDIQMSLVSLDHDHVERDSMANDHVRPMVSEWANVPEDELELKSFYGIREYYRGNELRVHIDVIATHVLSAVLCIEQVGIDEDWMLEVIDHYGERTEVACSPKQVILYESASLPHGRPFPLNGDKFVNAFVHYRPKGWDFLEHTWGVATSATNFQPRGTGLDRRSPDDEDFELDAEFGDVKPLDEEEEGTPPAVEDDGKRKAIFTNRATAERDLWWQGPNGIILQGGVAPGTSVEINSFVGHKFIWSTTDNKGTQDGEPHESGAEALRGERIGDTVEITKEANQAYSITDDHDEL